MVPCSLGATVFGLRNAEVEKPTTLKTEQFGANIPEGLTIQQHGCENLKSPGS